MKKSINPLWGARFKQQSSDLLEKINNSIGFDYKLVFQDIRLNSIYSKSLYQAKIITRKEYEKISKALKQISEDLNKGNFDFNPKYEDIHMNIEMALREKIGNLAGKIHTGKSRNDQVATDLKLWVKEKIQKIITKIVDIQKTIINKAEKNLDVIMPGFTHLQNAQPILFSHYIMSFLKCLREISLEPDILKKFE